MKNLMITAFVLFLLASAFSALKVRQIKKMAASKAALETQYSISEKEKANLQIDLQKLKADNDTLRTQKVINEKQLAEYKAATEKKIKDYEKAIAKLKEIPADTVYEYIFSRWNTEGGVLKYRFAENQIRGIHLNMLERDHYLDLYGSTSLSLNKCSELNAQNDLLLTNLTGQNDNLQQQNIVSGKQITTLQSELKLSDKLINKQKTKTFLYKTTTVIASLGVIFIALK